ncbi:MAG TPA: CvpA family protein [Thermomicrobiaceae bacterium]|nr:CvpA family protein [Thermomicrobiaceae bacterium]
MNWLGIVLIIIVIIFAAEGVRRGLLRGAIDVALVIVSLLAAAVGYHQSAKIFSHFGLSAVTSNILGFILILIVVQVVITFVLGLTLFPLIGVARSFPPLRVADDTLGIIPGVVKGLVFAGVLVMALSLLPINGRLGNALGSSSIAQRVMRRSVDVIDWGEQKSHLDLSDFTIMVEPSSETGIKLPFKVTNGLKDSPADEAEMLTLLNQSRRESGLPPLALDQTLTDVARAHSRDMFEQGYFAHDSPNGSSPFDRMKAAGVNAPAMGENLAYAPSVEVAERGLMRSPGHRANILSSDFSKVGIGVVVAPNGSKMFTQDFAG